MYPSVGIPVNLTLNVSVRRDSSGNLQCRLVSSLDLSRPVSVYTIADRYIVLVSWKNGLPPLSLRRSDETKIIEFARSFLHNPSLKAVLNDFNSPSETAWRRI